MPEGTPSDLTDVEWERIEPLLPKVPMQDGKPTVDLREIVNALRFKMRITAGWSMLLTEFGSRYVVHWWFRRFLRRLLLRMVYDIGTMSETAIQPVRQRHLPPCRPCLAIG